MAAGRTATTAAGRNLQETPTWALATVCFIFISLSLCIEQLIHLLSHWLKKCRKNALYEAVEKLKSVLMVLGFMSLTLNVTSRYIIKICIPNKVAFKMLPCRHSETKTTKSLQERILAAEATAYSDYCTSKGMTSVISQDGMNQLNNFIFVLAVMQIVYSVLTMALGRAKMRRWETWEKETQTVEYQAATDPNRFRFTRQTTFGRRHMTSCTTTSFQLWTKCFFRQFFSSVAKVDYLTLRHGFIAAHLSNNNSFNFQKYIQRSLDDDFRAVVGISPLMWFLVVIFMLVDVHGWHVYLWVSFLPLTIVLVLGTKLQVVVAKMALQLQDQNNVIKGALLVQPNDNLFWFHHPKYVLTLLHYTLFMNAFELAFFVWVTFQFGITSCYHEHTEIIAVRVVLAVTVQIICSYITLPLYALVTQMGSEYKSAVLEEETAKVIRHWHAEVKQKRKKKGYSPTISLYPLSPISKTSNRTMDSPEFHSKNQLSSPNLSSYNRSPTFSEIPRFPSQTEIVPHDQEISQDMILPSTVVEIEMPNMTSTQDLQKI
ncbi:MLO-like protein 3 isoform X1 [Ricinus communis]|uniref:MLO-like protein 3 isoform X1 n=1 Tax=Ricinus communis TaxID=3988 RepID=UPI00201A91A0|nr:MLO-like protein 3 isoform X1 [Ricinus communis]